jgi:hypothetical protein
VCPEIQDGKITFFPDEKLSAGRLEGAPLLIIGHQVTVPFRIISDGENKWIVAELPTTDLEITQEAYWETPKSESENFVVNETQTDKSL